jgi:predicted Zn-dependent protease
LTSHYPDDRFKNLSENFITKDVFMKKLSLIPVLILAFLNFQCASSTESGETGMGRQQLMLVSSAELESQSAQAYEEVKKEANTKGTLDRSPEQLRRLQKIAQNLIPQTSIFRKDTTNWNWEVHILTAPDINAYCMPGGKIMFYTGIIEQLKLTDAEIAAIMGHEIAHAVREHGRERMSEEIIKMGIIGVGVKTGVVNEKYAGALVALSGVMISLPHGRNQESEADIMGIELMARAGYNPRAAVDLWQKMASNGGGKPPEILSTHPSDTTRIKNIEANLPKVMPLYNKSTKH